MIRILGKLPKNIVLACSGGPDSMAVLDFLIKGKKNVTVAYFNHGTAHGYAASEFISDFCNSKNIPFVTQQIKGEKPSDQSWEEWWRNCRYEFFRSFENQIITCHHLNDVAEWWMFTSLNGIPRLIPYSNGNVIRPFLSTKKSDFIIWCEEKNVPYVNDPGNLDTKFARSRIRNNIMPEALKINPGFLKVLGKRINKEFKV
jgi:tRNA(Ile)-lysidine synthetase-like protein